MEVPAESDISLVYKERRLDKLRQLAIEANILIDAKLVNNRLSYKKSYIINPKIENIEDRDDDYLYFAICNRVQSGIINLVMPQDVGYGFYYDKVFKLYAIKLKLVGASYKFTEKWLPYLMLKSADALWMAYGVIYDYTKANLLQSLNDLNNGTSRDNIVKTLSNMKKRVLCKNVINMMIDGEFDVLDTIYILCYTKTVKGIKTGDEYDTIMNFIKYSS
jgi:hypothetical protein